MSLETPKTDTEEYTDEAIALANSAKELTEQDGEDAVVLKFPDIRQSEAPQDPSDTLIESYGKALADRREPASPETKLTLRGRAVIALGGIAGVAALVGIGAGLHEATDTDFHGEKTVVINEGTVTEIANNDVDGGANHTADTVNKIVAMNPDVFQNGKAFVESKDLGEKIVVPESAE